MKKRKLDEKELDEQNLEDSEEEYDDSYYDEDEYDEDDYDENEYDEEEYDDFIGGDDIYADGASADDSAGTLEEADDGGKPSGSETKKPNKLQEKVAELEDRVKRQIAEFDNFRKRSEKEKTAMFETGARSVIEKILPVVDNFERGLAGLSEEEMKTPFAEGMNMVYKQLITELEKLDVKPIEALGCEFNPGLHNAVMQVESSKYESGIIAQELQKGYTYRDSVVRHSMVAVVM